MRDVTEMLDEITASRGKLPVEARLDNEPAEEGGCGVTGFIANIRSAANTFSNPQCKCTTAGNGKGAASAAVGLDPKTLWVSVRRHWIPIICFR